MQHYIYHGPLSSVTLRAADNPAQEIDIILTDGAKVALPESHEYTQALLAQQFLTPVDGNRSVNHSQVRQSEGNQHGS